MTSVAEQTGAEGEAVAEGAGKRLKVVLRRLVLAAGRGSRQPVRAKAWDVVLGFGVCLKAAGGLRASNLGGHGGARRSLPRSSRYGQG